MAKKIQTGKDVASYKWVKIIQSLLLIIFGVVLCAFSYSKDIQNALGYITASIILLYGFLTIGFGMVFARGTLSTENVSGSALVALSILIYINPDIVMDYIPTFAGVMFLSFGAIFLFEAILNSLRKNRHTRFAVINYISAFIFLALGITTLALNYSNAQSNQELIRIILIIIIGVILIISGIFLIIYYALNPKFKVKQRIIVNKEGTKRYTVIEGNNIPYDDPDELIEEKKVKRIEKKSAKSKRKSKYDDTIENESDNNKNEISKIE